jgi:hypothetical protein
VVAAEVVVTTTGKLVVVELVDIEKLNHLVRPQFGHRIL